MSNGSWELSHEVPPHPEDEKRRKLQRVLMGIAAILVLLGLIGSSLVGLFI